MDYQNKWVGLNVKRYWGLLCNGVDWGRLTDYELNLIVKNSFFCRMPEYLSYEETAAFIEATKWNGYKFLSSEDVYNNIRAIPDELYGEEPQEQLKEQESETVLATEKEMSKASSVAQILNLVDNQKAAAIKDYVRKKFGRQLVRNDSEDQNCFFQSVLMQLGNKESMVDEKGNLFSPQNFRLQAIDYVAVNYSDMYPVLEKHITTSLKTWCTKMLSDQEPADFPLCVAVRYLIDVSK